MKKDTTVETEATSNLVPIDGGRAKKKKKDKPAKAEEPETDTETTTDEATGDEADAASDDGIYSVALTDEQKTELRIDIRRKKKNVESAYFDFADGVFRAYETAAYKFWRGPVSIQLDDGTSKVEDREYKTFGEYVENELGISTRTADYYNSICRWFTITLKNDLTVKEKVKELGWSKTKELVDVVDATNVDEWVAKAKNMTVSQLAQACKEWLNRGNEDNGPGEEVNVKRKTFTLKDDQIKVVEDALEHATGVTQSDKDGYLITMICQDYLASSVRAKEGTSLKSAYMKRMETLLGVKLIAVDAESKGIVFGRTTFSNLTKPKE